ncbi:hypothetical protein O181_077671 [Austropuccinia psidii MF-1]|uniref:Uncharacterized protein n=1 Tax=Austropuccinia psidii MF-1 TaxID=1389203 RepID=A0A9Q3ICB4_9BASI|nr:hypothetical protein [Austropuccinia psidii MF-1]
MAEVAKKKNTSHNFGLTDHYANNCPKSKKNVYSIEQFPEEESPTEDSESDCMGDAIRKQSDYYKDLSEHSSGVPRVNTTRTPGHTVRGRYATRYCK